MGGPSVGTSVISVIGVASITLNNFKVSMEITRERRIEIRRRLGLNRDGGKLSRDIWQEWHHRAGCCGCGCRSPGWLAPRVHAQRRSQELNNDTNTTDAPSESVRRHAIFAIFGPAIVGSRSTLNENFTTQVHIYLQGLACVARNSNSLHPPCARRLSRYTEI